MITRRRSRGFTLAEVAVAFVIIALLLAGVMIPLSAQVEARNVGETRRLMEQVREALIGYAQINGRLPCPADGTIASGSSGAGTEQYNSTVCTATAGALPWSTLGLPETDAWGRRLSYYVNQEFADNFSQADTPPCTPSPARSSPMSFALCSTGTLTVNSRSESTHTATAIGSNIPVVIISHGKNGYGAYTPNGGARLSGYASGSDEEANATNTSTTFYSRVQSAYNSDCSETDASKPLCEFDDIVYMIPPSTLIARMVTAGRLP